MASWQIGLVLAPFLLFAVSFLVLYPARKLVMRYLPDGRFKKVLLLDRDKNKVLFVIVIVLLYVGLFGAVHCYDKNICTAHIIHFR